MRYGADRPDLTAIWRDTSANLWSTPANVYVAVEKWWNNSKWCKLTHGLSSSFWVVQYSKVGPRTADDLGDGVEQLVARDCGGEAEVPGFFSGYEQRRSTVAQFTHAGRRSSHLPKHY